MSGDVRSPRERRAEIREEIQDTAKTVTMVAGTIGAVGVVGVQVAHVAQAVVGACFDVSGEPARDD